MSSQSISFPFTSFSGGWKTHDCLGFPVPFRSNRRKGLCGIVVALKGFLKGFFAVQMAGGRTPCWLVWVDVLRVLLRTPRKLKLKIYFKLLECFKMKNKPIKIKWECFYLQLAQSLTQKSMTTMLFGIHVLLWISWISRFLSAFFLPSKKWSFPKVGLPPRGHVFSRLSNPSIFWQENTFVLSGDFPETKTSYLSLKPGCLIGILT